ncbi:MAG TPA: class I SAM-dependent methyltransferase, partial [Patescibacteria group bacterium]|nr:class I SAM-dependent methyltransferase [Patescibacteria group bacterium]
DRVEISEGDVRLAVDLREGQKTGLFLDQRENHMMARSYASGRVLDAFTYNGGFALQVAGVAESVLAVDLSADALARVSRNAARNGLANVSVREANVFDLLRELFEAGERFDTVILDPPAFAKSKGAVEKAARGYKEINLRALRLLSPGGRLATFSCSHHVDEGVFERTVREAADDAGVRLRVLERLGQAADHPVLLTVPETRYLKGLLLQAL